MRRHIGAHSVEVAEDLIIAQSHGAWTVEEIDQLIAIWDEVKARHGRIYYIGDFSDGLVMNGEVRRRVIGWGRSNEFAAIALVLTSVPVRALATLLVRASQLVNPRSANPAFCATFEEARRYIESKRLPPR